MADHLTAERFVKESVANLRASIAAEIDRARAEGRADFATSNAEAKLIGYVEEIEPGRGAAELTAAKVTP